MDELFEALTLVQTKKVTSFPIVLLGSRHWSGSSTGCGILWSAAARISADDLDLLHVTDSVDETIAIIDARNDAASGDYGYEDRVVSGTTYSVCVLRLGHRDPTCLRLAADVGTEIGRRGWQLVSGGGNISMMGEVARAARAAGAHTIEVIPKMLVHLEVADVDADELVVTDTMNERKQVMAERADAFLTLPGGIGTLEELFETWTAGYLWSASQTRGAARSHRALWRLGRLAGYFAGARFCEQSCLGSLGRGSRHRCGVHSSDAVNEERRSVGMGQQTRAETQTGNSANTQLTGNSRVSGAPTVGLMDLARRLPGLALDAPGIVRTASGFRNRPTTKTSIGLLFQHVAQRHPDRPFLRFEGATVSYREANETVNRYAAILTGYGVRRGDVVGLMITNRPETLFLMLATVKLGATAGMLNHNQRDDVLAHSIGLLQARLLVVGAECRDAVGEIEELPTFVLSADDLVESARTASAADPGVCAEITAGERAFLIFTSGTTGLPKASVMTHLRWSKSMAGIGNAGVRLHGKDTLLLSAAVPQQRALTVALSSVIAEPATLALGRKFSASQFWVDAIRDQATAFIYIGELCRYLLNQPVRPEDRSHHIRLIVGNGLRPELWDEFRERFGVRRIVEFYGASEAPLAFVNVFDTEKTAGVGVLPYAIVDYDGDTGQAKRGPNGRLRKVGRGGVGLLLAKVTPRSPFDGYTDKSSTEQKLVRDGFKNGDVWFDTGDLVLDQGMNHIAFVDRLGDTFRWKGENVATTQVEGAICVEDDIDQAVVYGVEIPGADGKAGMAAITLREGATFDGAGLARRLYERLPSYAIPLFIRIVDELEQTSTFKSRKVELRNAGYGDSIDGRRYVLGGRAEGYVDAYGYPREVADGKRPRG